MYPGGAAMYAAPQVQNDSPTRVLRLRLDVRPAVDDASKTGNQRHRWKVQGYLHQLCNISSESPEMLGEQVRGEQSQQPVDPLRAAWVPASRSFLHLFVNQALDIRPLVSNGVSDADDCRRLAEQTPPSDAGYADAEEGGNLTLVPKSIRVCECSISRMLITCAHIRFNLLLRAMLQRIVHLSPQVNWAGKPTS